MPLSKARNRERMRKARLHKRLLPLLESKPVQPKWVAKYEGMMGGSAINQYPYGYPGMVGVDADGNPIYEPLPNDNKCFRVGGIA